MDAFLFWINVIIITVGELFECTFIVFLTVQFLKKRSDLQQAFYYVLYVTYILDAVSGIPKFVMRVIGPLVDNVFVGVCQLIAWYYYYSPGICELILALNRCTGVAFPVIHKKIWHGKVLHFSILLIFAFPLIVSGYTLSDFFCRLYPFAKECTEYTKTYVLTVIFINITLSTTALIVIFFGVCMSSRIPRNNTVAKLEKKMIFYTMISTTLLTLRYICALLSYFNNSMAELFDSLTSGFYYSQHYLPLLLLPVLNTTYRNELTKFLKFRKTSNNQIINISTITL